MATQEMIDAVRDNDKGGWLTGGDPVADIAQEWEEWGFDADEVVAWWDAGCFDPAETSLLRSEGLEPEQVGVKLGNSSETIGYMFCNGDLNITTVLEVTA